MKEITLTKLVFFLLSNSRRNAENKCIIAVTRRVVRNPRHMAERRHTWVIDDNLLNVQLGKDECLDRNLRPNR